MLSFLNLSFYVIAFNHRPHRLYLWKFMTLPRSAPDLWKQVASFARPADYRQGVQIRDGLFPDNLLVFPFGAPQISSSRGYGHYHPRFVLDIVQRTAVHFQVGQRQFTLGHDECVLIFPHQFHDGHIEPSATEGEGGCIVMTFDLEQSARIESLRSSPRKLRGLEKGLIQKLITRYRTPESGLELAWLLSQLLLRLAEAPKVDLAERLLPETPSGRAAFLEEIHRLFALPSTGKALPALAKEMNLSEAELNRRFRFYTGGSFAEYARRHRMTAARTLLVDHGESVAAVSQQLGFSSIPAFSRAFRTTFGLSPKQYQQAHQKNQ